MSDEELETLLTEPSQVKALNFLSDNYLFYSLVQILGHLDHSKKAVFQKGWKEFYQEHSESLKSSEKETKNFKNFFSAFNEYMKELWDPSQIKVGGKSENGLVHNNPFTSTDEMTEDCLGEALSEFSKHLNFLRPAQKDALTQIQEKIEETDSPGDQDNLSNLSQEDSYELSFLNWIYFDLSRLPLKKRKILVNYYTEEGCKHSVSAVVPFLRKREHQFAVTFGNVADSVTKMIPELTERDYWITDQRGDSTKLLHPDRSLDLSEDYNLFIWGQDLTKINSEEYLEKNQASALVKFNLVVCMEIDTHQKKNRALPLIFEINLSGKLKKLRMPFLDSLRNFFNLYTKGLSEVVEEEVGKTPDQTTDQIPSFHQRINSLGGMFPKQQTSSLFGSNHQQGGLFGRSARDYDPFGQEKAQEEPPLPSLKERIEALVGFYDKRINWEKKIISSIDPARRFGSHYLVEIPTTRIDYSINGNLILRSLKTNEFYWKGKPLKSRVTHQLLALQNKRIGSFSVHRLFSSPPEILLSDPESLTALYSNQKPKTTSRAEGEKETEEHASMLVYKMDSGMLRNVFLGGRTYESVRDDIFGGEFELKAIIQETEFGVLYPTIVQKEVEKVPEEEKIEEKSSGEGVNDVVKRRQGEDRMELVQEGGHQLPNQGKGTPAIGGKTAVSRDSKNMGNLEDFGPYEQKTYFYEMFPGVAQRLTGDSLCSNPVYLIYVRREQDAPDL